MPRNCLSGVSMDWLLLFLLQLCDLASSVDNSCEQNEIVVCAETQARFRWNYKVKSFVWTVWYHKREKIAASANLPFSPEDIISDQFKGRLKFNATNPFSLTLENATKEDDGTYECVFSFDDGSTDCVKGNLEVIDFRYNDTLVMEVEKNDTCVKLTCRADPLCTWIFPNGTSKVAKTIRYCSNKKNETIRCESESDQVCTYAIYRDTCASGCGPQSESGFLVDIIVPTVAVFGICIIIISIYRCRQRIMLLLPWKRSKENRPQSRSHLHLNHDPLMTPSNIGTSSNTLYNGKSPNFSEIELIME